MKRNSIWKKQSTKLFAAVLCFVFAFGPSTGLLASSAGAFAAPGSDPASKDTLEQIKINEAAKEAAKELFTLEQVRKEAKARGAETLRVKADLVVAQASKDSADMSVNDAWDALGASYTLIQTGALPASALATAEAQLARAYAGLDQADDNLEDAKDSIASQTALAEYNGEELFFSWLQLNDSLALLDKTIDLSREQLKIEELKARIGLSTTTEVIKKALALEELLERRQTLVNGIDMTGRSLMRQLGKKDDHEFRLNPAFSIEGLRESYDPDWLSATAVDKNLNLKILNRSIDKMKDNISSGVLAFTDRNVIDANRDSLILTRDNLIQGMKTLARATATGLDTAKADIALLEKTVAEKQTAHDIMSLQVSLGLAPKIGLYGAELDLLSAQSNLTKAQQNYYLSLRKAALLVDGVAVSAASGQRG